MINPARPVATGPAVLENELGPACTLALAWQPAASRPALACLLQLDDRLAGAVARASEPMLAQIRLAWWRERLRELNQAGPGGEPLLAAIHQRWGAASHELAALVDGWEELAVEAPLSGEAIGAFAAGRGEAMAAFARLVGEGDQAAAAHAAGRLWALAEVAGFAPTEVERERAREFGRVVTLPALGPRTLRGVAVLGGLARQALSRNRRFGEGRRAALAAMRLGMFGL